MAPRQLASWYWHPKSWYHDSWKHDNGHHKNQQLSSKFFYVPACSRRCPGLCTHVHTVSTCTHSVPIYTLCTCVQIVYTCTQCVHMYTLCTDCTSQCRLACTVQSALACSTLNPYGADRSGCQPQPYSAILTSEGNQLSRASYHHWQSAV